MWLSDRRPGDLASAAIHLRTRIKKRSAKYTFYKPKNRRGGADAGSEKVDWVFVGFPSSNTSASTDPDNAPLTFEPLRRAATTTTSTPASADLRPSASFTAAEPLPVLQPLDPILTAAAAFNAEPPPLPPRAKNLNRRPPPPRPTSLYASLNRNVQIPNPADEYAQVIRSGRRNKGQQQHKKRPRSSEAAVMSQEGPPIPRHMHGSGVPVPLPDSPPAPPLPPHNNRHPPRELSPPPLPRFESLSRSIESPFYQRPMSLASSSLARSMSSSHLISSYHRNASLHIERSYDSVQASSLEVQRQQRRSMKANSSAFTASVAADMDVAAVDSSAGE